MLRLKDLHLVRNIASLSELPEGKVLINTINAFSYNNARKDELFAEALMGGDALIPDGASVVKAMQFLGVKGCPTERVAGWDLFCHEMKMLDNRGGKVLFVGSSDKVLEKIRERCAVDYPNVMVDTFSPPYKPEFSDEDNREIVDTINISNPDLLWIGMTAPKQEKWTYSHWDELNIHCHCGTIGAVFDFFAGTKERAPLFMQQHGLEWLYRLCQEPGRMWKRYIIGNVEFLWYVFREKMS